MVPGLGQEGEESAGLEVCMGKVPGGMWQECGECGEVGMRGFLNALHQAKSEGHEEACVFVRDRDRDRQTETERCTG